MWITNPPRDLLGICGVSRVIRECAVFNQLMLPLSARMKESFQWKINIVCKFMREIVNTVSTRVFSSQILARVQVLFEDTGPGARRPRAHK